MIIERLAAAHDVDTFRCGNEDLDLWLRHAALNADRAGTSRVYVHLDDDRVVGYFAIAPHLVRRSDVPSSIGRGAPDTIPGFLLARLALAADLKGGGRGGELPVTALEKILQAILLGGGRLINRQSKFASLLSLAGGTTAVPFTLRVSEKRPPCHLHLTDVEVYNEVPPHRVPDRHQIAVDTKAPLAIDPLDLDNRVAAWPLGDDQPSVGRSSCKVEATRCDLICRSNSCVDGFARRVVSRDRCRDPT